MDYLDFSSIRTLRNQGTNSSPEPIETIFRKRFHFVLDE